MNQQATSAHDICGLSQEAFLVKAEEFHGHVSPGLVLGAFLADAAWGQLGDTPNLNVVAETVVCLPDAVQILTPCTMGNGFLQVLDWGKFAVTFYDRLTLRGYRAWADLAGIAAVPAISGWFMRGSVAEPLPKDEVVKHLLVHGPSLAKVAEVTLPRALKPTEKVATGPCPQCGESYPLRWGASCPACQGMAYYQQV